jgi:glycosyltransferase involved in cell wall biosynthesis
VPPPIDFDRLHPRPASPRQPPLLLFVGRIAPNKRHDLLLRTLAVLREVHNVDAHLVIAGSAEDTESYLRSLRRLAVTLRINAAVDIIASRVRDRELGGLYRRANVFVSTSEHEGLCVPLLEAMAFSVPVVARAAAAVPETVRDAGLLLRGDDPFVYAEAVGRAVYDLPLRRGLIAAGHRRLADFSESAIETRLAQALRGIGVVP